MDRRTALGGMIDAAIADPSGHANPSDPLAFTNTQLPNTPRALTGLEPYTGLWTKDQIFHLLRRATFGPSPADAQVYQTMNMSQALDTVLSTSAVDSKPLATDSREMVAVGDTWVYANAKDPASTFDPTSARIVSLKSWWAGLMLQQSASVMEKMVLFWHNLLVTERDVVNEPRFSWRYTDILRRNALGNWKDMVRELTVDGGMLRYLNGNVNTRTNPNENYGRELQELFTIGKGAIAGPGDYTTYTEADVKAAAKVLTGWQEDSTVLPQGGARPSKFTLTRHDTTDKQFSNRYGNTVIKGNIDGMVEINALLDMIFAQEETAKYLCRRLYRWFVYYVIDEAAEANVIVPMASLLRQNNYNVLPVLRALFTSAHFYDPLNIGCMIKSPLEFAVGIPRIFTLPYPADVTTRYKVYYYIATQAAAMQQDIADPPAVAGWPAYYQSPQFYELWINSDTLPRRANLSNLLVRSGYSTSGFKYVADLLTFTATLSDPSNIDSLIDEATRLIFAIPLTSAQKLFLKQTLIPGLPDYEWTLEWGAYVADPGNATKKNAVLTKLQSLYAFMLSMPEFQLQ
jgi:uncharacterized protein (DUF1800 family)